MPRPDLLRALGLTRRRETDRAVAQAVGDLNRRLEASEARGSELAQQLAALQRWLQQTSDRSDEVAGRLEAAIVDRAADQARLERLVPNDERLDRSGGLELETFEVDGLGRVVGFRDGGDETDGVYLAFEDWFRGSEATIADRQRAYLPLIRDHAPVLDVGCGRGEFLGILRDAGVDAAGVDIDEAMIKRARTRGFDVHQADAIAYLEGLAVASLGAVFAAQMIEHLPYQTLVRFLRAARTALTPGGLLIMETVNPHAPQALKHFWIDPTHQHPLFPEVVVGFCQLTGFSKAYIWYPQGTGDPERDRQEQADYAVLAEAPEC
jgi:SAM-dependent methyltransferase